MDIPRRILDGGAGEWERSVLLSAAEDAPSAELRRNLQKSLLVGSSAALVVSSASQAKGLGAAFSLKWLALGLVAGGIGTSAGVHWASEPAPPLVASVSVSATSIRAHAPNAVSPKQRDQALEVPSARRSTAPPVGPLPLDRALGPSEGSSTVEDRPVHDSATTSAPELAEQLSIIQGARAALTAGDPALALQRLDSYDYAHPEGQLAIEAQVLRIEALATRGDHAAARTLAENFLKQHPRSPYEQRVRALRDANP